MIALSLATKDRSRRTLRAAGLVAKVLVLLAVGYALFPFWKVGIPLWQYFVFAASLTLVLVLVYWRISERGDLRFMIGAWALGSALYLLIAVPFALLRVSPSPMLHDLSVFDGLLYSFLRPVALLGVLAASLSFVRFTSPIEFLPFGRPGYWCAVLLRSAEFAGQELRNTQVALLIQGEWPEAGQYEPWWRHPRRVLRSGPILVGTAFRNLLMWGPWAYLCFLQLRKAPKGDFQ